MVVGYHHLRKHPYVSPQQKVFHLQGFGFVQRIHSQKHDEATAVDGEGLFFGQPKVARLPGNNGPSVSWLVTFFGKPTNLGFRKKNTGKKKKTWMAERS